MGEEFDSEVILEDHKVNVHKHSKTTFKEFGGGLMMMMITETQEPSEEEQDDKKEEDFFGPTESPMDYEEICEEATDIKDSLTEENHLEVVPMDKLEKSEGTENKKEFDADLGLSENENINVFGTGFFVMYNEESDGYKSDEKDSVSAVFDNGNVNIPSGEDASINYEIGKDSSIQDVNVGDACNKNIEEPRVDDREACLKNTKEYDEQYSPEL